MQSTWRGKYSDMHTHDDNGSRNGGSRLRRSWRQHNKEQREKRREKMTRTTTPRNRIHWREPQYHSIFSKSIRLFVHTIVPFEENDGWRTTAGRQGGSPFDKINTFSHRKVRHTDHCSFRFQLRTYIRLAFRNNFSSFFFASLSFSVNGNLLVDAFTISASIDNGDG